MRSLFRLTNRLEAALTDVTGSAQTGLTSPTYTVSVDVVPPGIKGKSYAFSALGGTQSGVEANVVGKPFTYTYQGPVNPKGPPVTNSNTGAPTATPRNVHKVYTRKGVEVVTGYFVPMNITTTIEVPAGAEIKDPESVRAGLSAHIGGLTQQSAALGDTIINGTVSV